MKYLQRIFSILLIASMLVGFLATGSILAGSTRFVNQQTDADSKFEPGVRDQLQSGNADFFVLMAEQADLSPAADLQTKQEKGQFVFKTVVDTSNRTQADLKAYLDQQGVQYTSYYVANAILVKAGNLGLANEIAGRKDVAQILANKTYQLEDPPADPKASNTPAGIESNLSFVNAPQVWDLGFTGQGTVLAGNDTGLDWDHPALIRQYRGCLNPPACTEIDHNYNWWDATGTSPLVPIDDNDHGTHTSGTMVGDDGGANQIGMAPGARLVHCKNMDGGGYGNDAWFLTCFQWDLAPYDLTGSNPNPDLAPDAVNNSWGYSGGGNPIFRDAIDALQEAGTLVEVSAGNEGPYCSTLRSPGDYQEVLTTGSVDHIGQEFPGIITVSFWSTSRGPSDLDGNYFPDIMAPGNGIRSSVNGGGYEGGWGGTSMAGPHATALVGLMWSANPALRGRVAETMDIIRETAGPLTGQTGSNCGGDYEVGPNNDWGFGTIDAFAAVQAAISMGGAGGLDGTVTDLESGDPIEGVNVLATHEAGFNWTDTTSATGYYTMTVAEGTYTVTVSKYGYLTQQALYVEVVSNTRTTQDFALVAAPSYTVSGHVYDAISGAPLVATVQFTDAPVPPVTTGPDGFYSLEVAEGTWNMLVQAPAHQEETLEILVDQDRTVDFYMNPLPCILLVDDDDDSPDVNSYYTDALDALGYDYDTYNVGGGAANGPDLSTLQGYSVILWFSGDKFGGSSGSAGPNATDETNLASYLDGGGKLFLDSQDYLYDFHLTDFGSTYLGIQSYTDDTGDATSIIGTDGDPIGDGLGPYGLSYPSAFSDYGDIVHAAAGASVAFTAENNSNDLDLDKDGGTWQTVFFGTSWVPVYNNNASNGEAVLQRVIDFFGGCVPPVNVSITPESQTKSGSPGEQVRFEYTVTNEASIPQEVFLTLEAGWPTEAPSTTGLLEGGESATIPVTVTIPMIPMGELGRDMFTLTATGSEGGHDNAFGTTIANANPAVELLAPEGKSGRPSDVVSYEFQLTNLGDYTDSFSLDPSGDWTTSLPGGDNTGLLGAGDSMAIEVLVQIPPDAHVGDTDITTLGASSDLDPAINTEAVVTTTVALNLGVELLAPIGQTGEPLDQLSYQFTLTNTGEFTDSFTLEVSGVWTTTLEGADNTGLLGPGTSKAITVLVTVPEGVVDGDTDVATLTAASDQDVAITASAQVTSTARVVPSGFKILMPIITR